MSRGADHRWDIAGTLVCCSPLHAGGLESGSHADMVLSINGDGRVCIPGTGLAGALRAWCERVYGEALTESVWGYQAGDDGIASWIVVDEAVTLGKNVISEVRDSVGIDRERGTAATGHKFDREIVRVGTRCSFSMRVECKNANRAATGKFLKALMQALASGEIRIGAGKSRGLGKVRLDDARWTQTEIGKRTGILELLRQTVKPVHFKPNKAVTTIPRLTVRITWKAVGPLMVRAAVDGVIIDSLPLLDHSGSKPRLVIPGTSIKGAWRAHAERICNTLFDPVNQPKFIDRIAHHPLVETLFGGLKDVKNDDGALPAIGLGALGVEDCLSDPVPAAAFWSTATDRSDDDVRELAEAMSRTVERTAGRAYFDPVVRVAIDRWTGGAAQGALYSVMEPRQLGWAPIVLEIDPTRLVRRGDEPSDQATTSVAALALLLLVLRDAKNGFIPLGFAVTRGFGTVAIDHVSFEVAGLDTDAAQGLSADLTSALQTMSKTRDLRSESLGKLDVVQSAWTRYLAAHDVAGAA